MKASDNVGNAFIYNDLNGLESIKKAGRDNEDKALMAVAQQFESMFITMVLKSSREANETMFQDSMMDSYESKFYQQMHDEQLALTLSQDQGLGLANVLFEQLKRDSDYTNVGNQTIDIKNISESLKPVLQKINQPVVEQPIKEQAPESDLTSQKLNDISASSIDLIAKFESPEHFVSSLMPVAQKVAKDEGLDPMIILAQAALETGWGKKIIHDDKGENSRNLFGVKASHGWEGNTANVTTGEFLNGKFVNVKADFRAYDSYEQSFKDYANFLKTNPRYDSALKVSSDLELYPKELQKAGYATDPLYSEKIQRVANNPVFTPYRELKES